MSASVSVLVDFSNGATKSFASVPWAERMSVTKALDAAAAIPPGLAYEFDSEFFDRGGRRVGTLKSVDGIGESDGTEWSVWLNGKPIGSLAIAEMEHLVPFGESQLEPGDALLVKLVGRPAG